MDRNNFLFVDFQPNTSPQASTEEKSIYDNLDVNRLSLEKGLQNRPSKEFLVDRGYLRNPGKAYSETIHQLELAKTRDKLKVKIEKRPERDELVRKMILQDPFDERESKKVRIKQILDESFHNRPGSLELVNKNILQVDRLLASKVQSGDIDYPKVLHFEPQPDTFSQIPSNTPPSNYPSFPPVTQVKSSHLSKSLTQDSIKSAPIDMCTSLHELNQLKRVSSSLITPSSLTNSAQISCKPMGKYGKFKFHHVEFLPPQKAREYQQSQLIQYQEELTGQRYPSMRKLHSELRRHSNCWLNRLTVSELRAECRARDLPSSNIPKSQLVNKLLPYEMEIMNKHSSSSNNNASITGNPLSNSNSNGNNKMSNINPPSIRSTNSYSNASSTSNPFKRNSTASVRSGSSSTNDETSPPQQPNVVFTSYVNSFATVNSSPSKMIHSNSEPVINDLMTTSSCMPFNPSLYYSPSHTTNAFTINRHSLVLDNNNNNINTNTISANPVTSTQLFLSPSYLQSNPQSHSLFYLASPTPTSQHLVQRASPSLSASSSLIPIPQNNHYQASPPILPIMLMTLPHLPANCHQKFERILKLVDQINFIAQTNSSSSQNFVDQSTQTLQLTNEYSRLVGQLSNTIRETQEFINQELKFKTILHDDYCQQINWLNMLLDIMNNNANINNNCNLNFPNDNIYVNSPACVQSIHHNINTQSNTNNIQELLHSDMPDSCLDDFNSDVVNQVKIDDLCNADFMLISPSPFDIENEMEGNGHQGDNYLSSPMLSSQNAEHQSGAMNHSGNYSNKYNGYHGNCNIDNSAVNCSDDSFDDLLDVFS